MSHLALPIWREAVREGAMAIDLIDGVELCGLLRDKGWGWSRGPSSG